MNYREISVGFRAKLKISAHLHRGRTVTQPRTGTFQSFHRRFLTAQGILDVDYDKDEHQLLITVSTRLNDKRTLKLLSVYADGRAIKHLFHWAPTACVARHCRTINSRKWNRL